MIFCSFIACITAKSIFMPIIAVQRVGGRTVEMMKGLKVAHWLGVFMLATGIMLYSFTTLTQEVSGILLISCLNLQSK